MSRTLFTLGTMAILWAAGATPLLFGQTEKTTDPAPPAVSESTFKVFSVEHLTAEEADAVIRQMFPNEPITSTPLPTTNQLILRADDRLTKVIEALLLQIDKPARGAAASSVPTSAANPQQLSQQPQYGAHPEYVLAAEAQNEWSSASDTYRDQEAKAREIAAQLRNAMKTMGNDHPRIIQLREDLKAHVNTLYEQRQNAHVRRIKQLEDKLNALRQKVDKQQASRDQMVEQRIDQLVSGRVSARVAARPTKNPYARQSHPIPYATLSLNAPDPHGALNLLTQIAETQNRIAKAEAEYEATSAELANAKKMLVHVENNEITVPERLRMEAEYRAQSIRRQSIVAEVKAARKLYELLKTQLATQRDLLRNDVQQAQIALAKAQRDLERASPLKDQNVISDSEMDSIQTTLDRTRLKFERAQKILDAFEEQSD